MSTNTSRRHWLNRLGALVAAGALTACAQWRTAGPSVSDTTTKAPKLIVLVVIDGLPMRQVTGYRDQLAPDGFARFLERGAWFSQAHYGHGHTLTAPGHSVVLTGAYPQRSGIISNEWRDRRTGELVYNTADAAEHYLEHITPPLAGTSPRNLKVETLGDVLRSVDPSNKVISISGKDRGAILPGGHMGAAYMYMYSSGQFASSTYYMAAHPQWVKEFNAVKPADAFFGKTWSPLLPESAYARSAPDGQPWQSQGGNHLPITLGDRQDLPGPRFYSQLIASPFGDELTLSFARAAIDGEGLGQRGTSDILSISLSGHDGINHAFGPESRLSHDHLLHLDCHLQAFFKYLDDKVGINNYVLALTADHGFADSPEWSQRQGLDAQRINPALGMALVNNALTAKFGEGRWATHYSGAGLLFNDKLMAERGVAPDMVYAEAKIALLQAPGITAVFTPDQLAGNDHSTPYLDAMRKSWHPDLAAPVQFVTKPRWVSWLGYTGTSHGTPHEYDTHVPLLFWGNGRVTPGERVQAVEVSDLASTLAAVLGVPAPAQSQGHALDLRN
jgi:predicted AlkP superfamily pyrophosphatase or phosphodiesterase